MEVYKGFDVDENSLLVKTSNEPETDQHNEADRCWLQL